VLIELIIKSVGKEMRRNRKGKNDLFSFWSWSISCQTFVKKL
jgi:hypothetical protein